MKTIRSLFAAAFTLLLISSPFSLADQLHSRHHEVVVLEPQNLPEQAQSGGNSLFLYYNNAARALLYVEQQQGARIVVFDVTDPASIKAISTISLTGANAFDFVRPLGNKAALVRFRKDNRLAVLDLTKIKTPVLHPLADDSGLSSLSLDHPLGDAVYLGTRQNNAYVPAVPRDYQVVDLSTPAAPAQIATIRQVKHEVTNPETGTTFLLGSDGLTVIRRTDVEQEHQIHEMQMSGN